MSLQVDEIKDQHGRTKFVDVFMNCTKAGLEAIKEENYIIAFKSSLDQDPRVWIPPTATKRGSFTSLKECTPALLSKLLGEPEPEEPDHSGGASAMEN